MTGGARQRRQLDVAAELAAAREGSHRAVARLVSVVADGGPQLREVAAALADGRPATAWVLGLTGPPGVGKSTTVSALVKALRARGSRVGVLAVDPSSPFSGGALLGDRVRMGAHALDDGVYVRSMASRGHLGGLAATTPQAVRVLEAAGVDVVLVETVGVGQSEVEVAGLADSTVVLLAPGMGDGVQAAKAGILEVADVLAVNKADRDGADATVRELRASVALGGDSREPGDWRPTVVRTVASSGDVQELLDALDAHQEWARSHGRAEPVRRRRAAVEVRALALALLQRRFGELGSGGLLDEVAAERGRRGPRPLPGGGPARRRRRGLSPPSPWARRARGRPAGPWAPGRAVGARPGRGRCGWLAWPDAGRLLRRPVRVRSRRFGVRGGGTRGPAGARVRPAAPHRLDVHHGGG